MKVCVLTHTFPKHKEDSTAAFMHSFVMGVIKSGNDVVVLTPYSPTLRKESFDYKIVSYKYIWPEKLHLLGYSSDLKEGMKLKPKIYFLAPFLLLSGILHLYQLCKREKIDVISSHWILPNGLIAAVVSRMIGIPYIVTLPGSDVFVAKKNWLFRFLAIYAANGASTVVADSPKFLETLRSLGPKIQNSEIIPYPVDIDKFKPLRKSVIPLRKILGLPNDSIIVLCVGRLVQKKGFKYAIMACSKLMHKNKNIYQVIVGDGDLRKELEDLVLKLKLKKRIIFVGNIERNELLLYYNMADIFVMPSIKDKDGNIDDQPVSLIEAMSCGKPVIATNFPGISLTVANEKNGFLTPQKNILAIRHALEKLIKSKELRMRMGRESRRIVLDKLGIEKIGKRYSLLLRNAVN